MSLIIKCLAILTGLLVLFVMPGCSGRATIQEEDQTRSDDRTVRSSPTTKQVLPKGTPSTLEVNPPTATPTRTAVPPATPTHSPGFAKLAQPTEFVSSKDYGEFGTGLRTEFQAAVDNEFSALEEKAGISVAVYTNGKLWTYATGEADKGVEWFAVWTTLAHSLIHRACAKLHLIFWKPLSIRPAPSVTKRAGNVCGLITSTSLPMKLHPTHTVTASRF